METVFLGQLSPADSIPPTLAPRESPLALEYQGALSEPSAFSTLVSNTAGLCQQGSADFFPSAALLSEFLLR